MNLYEVFINIYIQEVRNLVKKGLRSDYLPLEDNLYFYKGQLMVQGHIKRNHVHKECLGICGSEFEKGINMPGMECIISV